MQAVAEDRKLRRSDVVEWQAADGKAVVGVLVADPVQGKYVVRPWQASRCQFGVPETVVAVTRSSVQLFEADGEIDRSRANRKQASLL